MFCQEDNITKIDPTSACAMPRGKLQQFVRVVLLLVLPCICTSLCVYSNTSASDRAVGLAALSGVAVFFAPILLSFRLYLR